MKLDPSAEMGGYPILGIREVVRNCRGCYGFFTERIRKLLKSTPEEAESVVSALHEAGYISRLESSINEKPVWTVTRRGNAFAMASTSKPLQRRSCDRIIREFLDRVDASERMSFAVRVEKVYLFGSYARGAERPNDIDVYVRLCHKSNEPVTQDRQFQARINEAFRAGRQFANVAESSNWPWMEVNLFLRNRSRALSITTMDDWVTESEESILIYRFGQVRVNPPYPTQYPLQ